MKNRKSKKEILTKEFKKNSDKIQKILLSTIKINYKLPVESPKFKVQLLKMKNANKVAADILKRQEEILKDLKRYR